MQETIVYIILLVVIAFVAYRLYVKLTKKSNPCDNCHKDTSGCSRCPFAKRFN